MEKFASAGSQRWLQVAVDRKPQLLTSALQRSGAIGQRVTVTWRSPLEGDDFPEYRDAAALEKTGIGSSNLKKPLETFWPMRGPGWDALGITSEGQRIFIEAKAHIPEAATPATKATATGSLDLINRSLREARSFYPKSNSEPEQSVLSICEPTRAPLLFEATQRCAEYPRIPLFRECR